jgi:DNA-binding NtrC family response regulator
VDVRLIASTNRDLRSLIDTGHFREDLFYRLNVINIVVPPLRDRKEDVQALVEHCLAATRPPLDRGPLSITPDAVAALTEHSWPGNVRELQNVVKRAIMSASSNVIDLDDLPPELRPPPPAVRAPFAERRRSVADTLYKRLVEDHQSFWSAVYPLFMRREISRDVVREVVRRGLQEAHGNYTVVARMFNMKPRDYKKFLNFLRKHECQPPFQDFRHDR